MFVLLAALADELPPECWMRSGTAAKRRYVAVHNIRIQEDMRRSLIPFHAITGCDSTSQFGGITKVKTWKIFHDHAPLLSRLGENIILDEVTLSDAEAFVCQLFRCVFFLFFLLLLFLLKSHGALCFTDRLRTSNYSDNKNKKQLNWK